LIEKIDVASKEVRRSVKDRIFWWCGMKLLRN